MKVRILILVLGVLFTQILLSCVSFSVAVQVVEGPIGFEQTVTKYTFYSKTFDVPMPQDARVQSSEVIVTLDSATAGDIYLSVDNVYCIPDHWSFPASNRYTVSFDCKNSLNSGGEHTVRFYTTVDVTNVKIDYKIIYTIMEKVKLHVFGTEYHPGDIATVFLQLLDENDAPITNSTCFVSIWDPDKIEIVENATMSYLDEGIYYYDMVVPPKAGVYMISAYCILPRLIHYNWTKFTFAYDGFECGGWNCGYGWGDGWYHEGRADVGSYSPYNGTYELRLRGGNGYVERSIINLCDAENVTLRFYYRAYSIDSSDEAYLNFWDGSWHTLFTWTDGMDDNAWHELTFNLSQFNLCTNILAFDATGFSGSGDYLYIDDVRIEGYKKVYYLTNETIYQRVRGSGELHVTPRDTGCYPMTAGFYYPGDYVAVQIKSDSPKVEVWVYDENKTVIASGNATIFSSVHNIKYFNFTAPSTAGLYTVYARCTYNDYKTDAITTFYVSPTQLTLIQGKVDDVYDYLTNTVYTLLVDINETVHNLNVSVSGNITVNLTEVENKLDYIIEHMATQDNITEVRNDINNVYNLIDSKWGNLTAQDIIDEIDTVGNNIISNIENVKDMLNCTVSNEVCNKLDRIENKVDLVLGNVSIIIYKENLILGNLTTINQNTEWLVECLNVSCDNSWIDSRFDSIDNSLSNIHSDLLSMNDTLYEMNESMYDYYWDVMYELETIQQELHSINITGNITIENLTEIIWRLRDLNKTLIQHDDFVRGDLKNEVSHIETMVDDLDDYIYVNITNTLDDVQTKTQEILDKWGTLNASILYDKMNDIYALLNQVYAEMATKQQCELILGNVTYLINYLDSKYGSYDWAWLDAQLSSLSSDISDVYNLVVEHNASVAYEINSVKNRIDEIWGTHNASEVLDVLYGVNDTVHDTNMFLKNDIENKLDNITFITGEIKSLIGSSGDTGTTTLFGYFNYTYSKLEQIHDDLIELKNDYNKTLIQEIYNNVEDLKKMHNCTDFNTTICVLLDQIENGVKNIEGSVLTNMEVTQLVYPGTQFKATITIVHISGVPVDADNITIRIYDPSQNLVFTGSPQHHESQGAYKFEWSVPANPALGVYTIYAEITVGNVTTVEYDVFRVAQTGPFDVIVEVLKKQVTPGVFVPAKITVENKGEVGVDATVTYWIEDSLGNTLSSAQETWFVPADGQVVKEVQLYLPASAKIGTYYFKAEAFYDITRPPATGYDEFYVIKQITPGPSGVSGGTYEYAAPKKYYNVTFNVSIPVKLQVFYKGQKIIDKTIYPGESILMKEGEYTFMFNAKGYQPEMITMKVDRNIVITARPEKMAGAVFPSIPIVNILNIVIFASIMGVITIIVIRGVLK